MKLKILTCLLLLFVTSKAYETIQTYYPDGNGTLIVDMHGIEKLDVNEILLYKNRKIKEPELKQELVVCYPEKIKSFSCQEIYQKQKKLTKQKANTISFNLNDKNEKANRFIFTLEDPHSEFFISVAKEENRLILAIGTKETFTIDGNELSFFNSTPMTNSVELIVKKEIKNKNYIPDKNLNLNNNGTIIDIGAHVGVVSVYYSKLYPKATIYAFEPVRENFEALLKNLAINNVKNVIPINKAVTCDGRDITMYTSEFSTGACTAIKHEREQFSWNVSTNIKSVTLNEIFEKYGISICNLLKIDCEGSEYEIFYDSAKDTLDKVEYIVGEFHDCKAFEKKGYRSDELVEFLAKNNIPTKTVFTEITDSKDKEPVDQGTKLTPITIDTIRQIQKKDKYYINRQKYLGKVIHMVNNLMEKKQINSVLELGPYKLPIVDGSDIMDKDPQLDNIKHHWDAEITPWPIKDKQYDLFIALQVFEHLGNKQIQAFKEVMRISKMAIISLPYKWTRSDNMNINIDHDIISRWTLGIKPVYKEVITEDFDVGKNWRRAIYFFVFD